MANYCCETIHYGQRWWSANLGISEKRAFGKEWLWKQRLTPSGRQQPSLWSFYLLVIAGWYFEILVHLNFSSLNFLFPLSFPFPLNQRSSSGKDVIGQKAQITFRSLGLFQNPKTQRFQREMDWECLKKTQRARNVTWQEGFSPWWTKGRKMRKNSKSLLQLARPRLWCLSRKRDLFFPMLGPKCLEHAWQAVETWDIFSKDFLGFFDVGHL